MSNPSIPPFHAAAEEEKEEEEFQPQPSRVALVAEQQEGEEEEEAEEENSPPSSSPFPFPSLSSTFHNHQQPPSSIPHIHDTTPQASSKQSSFPYLKTLVTFFLINLLGISIALYASMGTTLPVSSIPTRLSTLLEQTLYSIKSSRVLQQRDTSNTLPTQADLIARDTKYSSTHETLIMADEFTTFDLSFWKHDLSMSGYGNNEFQIYTNNRSNSYVKEGVLFLQPTFTSDKLGEENIRGPFTHDIYGTDPPSLCTSPQNWGCMRTADPTSNLIINPIISARLSTSESFSFRYSRVEIRAKLPRGDWLFPSISLLPKHRFYGSPWCASGEIRLESRGNDPALSPDYEGFGCDSFGSTLHWCTRWNNNRFDLTTSWYKYPGPGTLHDDYHTFGMVWTPTQLYTYIDVDDASHRVLDVVFQQDGGMWKKGGFDAEGTDSAINPWSSSLNIPSAPFDQEFYLVLNLAVGGGFFPPGKGNRPWTDSPASQAAFWNAKSTWYPTWIRGSGGADDDTPSAFAIDYVRVYQKDTSAMDDISHQPGLQPTVTWGNGASATSGSIYGVGESVDEMVRTTLQAQVISSSSASTGAARRRRRRRQLYEIGKGTYSKPIPTDDNTCSIRLNFTADLAGKCSGVSVGATDITGSKYGRDDIVGAAAAEEVSLI